MASANSSPDPSAARLRGEAPRALPVEGALSPSNSRDVDAIWAVLAEDNTCVYPRPRGDEGAAMVRGTRRPQAH